MKAQALRESQLQSENEQWRAQVDELSEQRQSLEMDKQRLNEQLDLVRDYMAQVKDALGSKYVQEVFGEILGSIELALNVDFAIEDVQSQLDAKEGQLRQWASEED